MTGGRTPRKPLDDAMRMLARRPLTRHELTTRLIKRGHDEDSAAGTVERLAEVGHVNDAALALDFILLRSSRLGHGRRRLLGDLERRGVDSAEASRAWQRAIDEEGLDPDGPLRERVRTAVERNGGKLDPRAYRRVYNSLLRAGFDAEATTRLLGPHRGVPDHEVS